VVVGIRSRSIVVHALAGSAASSSAWMRTIAREMAAFIDPLSRVTVGEADVTAMRPAISSPS
jgi:hypothetical protein